MPVVSVHSICRKAAGAILLAGLCGAKIALAQYEPPPPPLTTAPCVPTKKVPCVTTQATPAVKTPDAAEQFPFPGDEKKPADATPADGKSTDGKSTDSKSTGEQFPFPEDTPTPVSPTAKHGQPVPPTDASKQFPFPADDAPASSSSSSSSANPDAPNPDAANPDAPNPDAPALKDMGSDGSTRSSRRKLPKVESMSARETEDLNVSKYYMSTGNIKGAYLRAQDAVKSVPDDPDAHLALAQAARKMNKKDEAVAEYNAYLKLEPDGEHARSVHEALAELK